MFRREQLADFKVRFPGLYVGKVEDIGDLGCVKVSVPAIFDQAKPDFFALARPCFPYAHFFVPEIGDHVWVAFENGDPGAPVWLGVWYPQGHVPSEGNVSPPVKRVIHSAKGHVLNFDDTDGSEKISLLFKGGVPGITIDQNAVTIKFSDSSYIELKATELKIVNTTLVSINP